MRKLFIPKNSDTAIKGINICFKYLPLVNAQFFINSPIEIHIHINFSLN